MATHRFLRRATQIVCQNGQRRVTSPVLITHQYARYQIQLYKRHRVTRFAINQKPAGVPQRRLTGRDTLMNHSVLRTLLSAARDEILLDVSIPDYRRYKADARLSFRRMDTNGEIFFTQMNAAVSALRQRQVYRRQINSALRVKANDPAGH